MGTKATLASGAGPRGFAASRTTFKRSLRSIPLALLAAGLASAPTLTPAQFLCGHGPSPITGYIIDGYTGPGGAVTIPSAFNGLPVVEINTYAFADCTNMTSVTIPNTIASIGAYAFVGCTGLTNVVIPDSVRTINDETFMACSNLFIATIGAGSDHAQTPAWYARQGAMQAPSGRASPAVRAGANCGFSSALCVMPPPLPGRGKVCEV